MARTLTVVFGSGKEFEFTLGDSELAAVTEDAAWRWLTANTPSWIARRRVRSARFW